MNDAEVKLIEEFPWLTDDDLQALSKKPSLAVFIEDGDVSLVAARSRHSAVMKEARLELRKRGKEPHKRMMSSKTIETTAYVDPLTEGG